jgi:hypothetical protein
VLLITLNEAYMTEPNKSKTGPKPKKLVDIPVPHLIVGRDKKPINPKEVYQLAALHCKDTEICEWLGIDDSTLKYNFKHELTKGRENLKQSLRQAQIKLALGGNATMLIWLGKNILGQSDNPIDTDDQKILPWEMAIDAKE